MTASTLAHTAQARWQALAARERRLVLAAAAFVVLALLWAWAISPALRTLRQAPAQRAALQAQAQRMAHMKAEAEALKALPRLDHDSARQALQAATGQRLGDAASLTAQGDRAQLVLKDAPAAALADWLADARANAHATPLEASLRRSGDTAAGAPVLWSGTVTLALPAP